MRYRVLPFPVPAALPRVFPAPALTFLFQPTPPEYAMSESLNRRDFITTSTVAGASLAFPLNLGAEAPAVIRSRAAKPVVIASANGNRSKDDAGKTCVQKAYEMMTGGTDVLDALVAGVTIVELDPADTSVGYGGLPNAD